MTRCVVADCVFEFFEWHQWAIGTTRHRNGHISTANPHPLLQGRQEAATAAAPRWAIARSSANGTCTTPPPTNPAPPLAMPPLTAPETSSTYITPPPPPPRPPQWRLMPNQPRIASSPATPRMHTRVLRRCPHRAPAPRMEMPHPASLSTRLQMQMLMRASPRSPLPPPLRRGILPLRRLLVDGDRGTHRWNLRWRRSRCRYGSSSSCSL
jgi:hypothetical protein